MHSDDRSRGCREAGRVGRHQDSEGRYTRQEQFCSHPERAAFDARKANYSVAVTIKCHAVLSGSGRLSPSFLRRQNAKCLSSRLGKDHLAGGARKREPAQSGGSHK